MCERKGQEREQKLPANVSHFLMKTFQATVLVATLALTMSIASSQQTNSKTVDSERLVSRAQEGYVQDQLQLAFALQRGEEVSRDLAAAAYWFTKAADQGNLVAQSNIAASIWQDWVCPEIANKRSNGFNVQQLTTMRRHSSASPTWR